MRTRALRPVRQERNRHILGPKLTVIDLYSPLVDTRDRFGKRVGVIPTISQNFHNSILARTDWLSVRALGHSINIILYVFALWVMLSETVNDAFIITKNQRHRTVPWNNLNFCQRMLHRYGLVPKTAITFGIR